MAYLLDTGVLLRLVNVQDDRYVTINKAVRSLVAEQEQLHITTQNIAEFWNVATRPVGSNGFGWSGEMAMASLTQEIEPVASVLLEARDLPAQLKRLISTYPVTGKQSPRRPPRGHDARLEGRLHPHAQRPRLPSL